MVILTLLSILWTHSPSLAKYDEIRDDRGRVRPAYKPLDDFFEESSELERRRFLRQSREAFDGDNALNPVPRVVSQKEFEFLRRGVDQRARALRAFLQDHYGPKNYLRDGVIPADVVERAIRRLGDVGYQGLVDPSLIAFNYGPDIVRAELNGELGWYVLEDNAGYVGGFGDLVLAHELILELHPGLSEEMKPNDPMEFYQALARSMRQKAAARDGIPVMLRCGGAAEHESERMQKIFSALGITTIDPESGGKFKVENNQVYLIEKDETGNRVKRKVGYIFIGEDLTWADRSFKPSMQKYIQDLALLFLEPGEGQKDAQDTVRNLLADINERSGLPDLNKIRRILVEQGFMDPNEKYLVPGLIEAALKGRVGLNNSAGTDFINDKEIYLYVEKFIRYYLRERPLLKNVPSRPFAKPNGELDPQVLDDVFDHIDQHVIKRFDGRGGSSVWIGGKLKPKERRELKAQIEQMPEFFKDQTKLVLSQMGDQIGDIRILAHVDSERVITANTGWGRNSPANGSGKVNLSAKGVEVAVLVNKRCEDRLR